MFEIILLVVFVWLMLVLSVLWLKFVLICLVILLVFPGLYATLRGAPYLPTGKRDILRILELGQFKKSDRVYDLGCGDGRVIRAVAEKGVKEAIGYEFSVPTFFFAKVRSLISGRGEVIYFADFWKLNFEQANVLICFLLSDSMEKFEKKIWPKLKKGTRVLSNQFEMKGVKYDEKKGRIYLYVKK